MFCGPALQVRLPPKPSPRPSSIQKSQMPAILKNIATLPVQALVWLGGQGTRAIAALVFIGITVPPAGELLKPYVTEAIFLLLCTSFLRVDLRALRGYLRRPGLVLSATAWTTI